jgi:hypothetical protein
MAGEIDACKIVPAYPEAFEAGRQIGQRSAADGNVGRAWTALSQYTQDLFDRLPQLPQQEKRKLWAAEQRDAVAGMACGDPKHFPYTAEEGEAKDAKIGQRPNVESQVNGIFNLLDRFNREPERDHSREPDIDLDGAISLANAQIHNKVEPLGLDARRAFVIDFNERRTRALDIPDVSLRAELIDGDRRVVIRREVN